jgi:hypothetical protein
MARKPGTNTPTEKVSLSDAVNQDLATVDQRSADLVEIDAKFGDGLPYAKVRVIDELASYNQLGSKVALEMGKRLILLKEHEGHGGFLKALDQLQINERAARRLMTQAVHFSNRTTLSDLGSSKLLELALLDDSKLDELEKGGTVAGLQVDDIAQMSVRELRDALRAEQEARADADAMVEKKNKKIDELDAKLTRRGKKPQWDEQAKEFSKAQRAVTDLNEENLLAQAGQIEELTEQWGELPDDQRSALAHAILDDVNRVLAAAFALQNLVTDNVAIHARQRATARD